MRNSCKALNIGPGTVSAQCWLALLSKDSKLWFVLTDVQGTVEEFKAQAMKQDRHGYISQLHNLPHERLVEDSLISLKISFLLHETGRRKLFGCCKK